MHIIQTTVQSRAIQPGTRLEAVPVKADYSGEYLLLGYQVTDGEHAGKILINGQYVLVENNKAIKGFNTTENKMVGELVGLINAWVDTPLNGSNHDDRVKFSRDLIQFFKTKL